MTERYEGELSCLRLFFLDLMPVVERQLGDDCLLYHAIKRGLARDDLEGMRRARRMFNHFPRSAREVLSRGLIERARRRAARSAARSPTLMR